MHCGFQCLLARALLVLDVTFVLAAIVTAYKSARRGIKTTVCSIRKVTFKAASACTLSQPIDRQRMTGTESPYNYCIERSLLIICGPVLLTVSFLLRLTTQMAD